MKRRDIIVGGTLILIGLAAGGTVSMEARADVGNLEPLVTVEQVAADDVQGHDTSYLRASLAPGLYGVSSSNPGELYSIDKATGAATSILKMSDGLSFSGVEELGGKYFVTDFYGSSCPDFCFGELDVVTGAITFISDQDGSWNWWGLASNESSGIMYTVDRDAGDILKKVTTSGATSSIGATGVSDVGSGLAYDDASGTLYAVGYDGNLYTLNTSTGVAKLIGPTGLGAFTNVHQGLAWDPDTTTLFLNEADTYDSLYKLNTTTGTATLVGPNGATAGDGIDGLMVIAGSSCPEDINGDGVVDILDLLLLLAAWGPC